MKLFNWTYADKYKWEKIGKWNHYNIHPEGDNRLIGQVWYSKTHKRWMFQPDGMALLSQENIESILNDVKKLNEGNNGKR